MVYHKLKLDSLGSHDLSAMREVFGMPQSVIGSSLAFPYWSAMFQYPGFVCIYESAIDEIPRFDASLEIFGESKSVTVTWDTPFVKGLPTKTHIKENYNDNLKETVIRSSYEDGYTLELKELYEFVKNGKPVKTTPTDAKEDIKIFQMLIKSSQVSK
jgi:predicted dehydrogenase